MEHIDTQTPEGKERLAQIMVEAVINEDEMIGGEAEEDEGAAWDYKQGCIMLSAFQNEGYITKLEPDPVSEPLETHTILFEWTEKAADGELQAKMIGQMLNYFDKIIIDEARWCLFKTIYHQA